MKNKNLWVRGTVKEFLGLNDEEEAIIERRLAERGLDSGYPGAGWHCACRPEEADRVPVRDGVQRDVGPVRPMLPCFLRDTARSCSSCRHKCSELPPVGEG